MLPCSQCRVYLFNNVLSYYVSLTKTKGSCAMIFVGLVIIVRSAEDFIFQNSDQSLLYSWEDFHYPNFFSGMYFNLIFVICDIILKTFYHILISYKTENFM